LLTSAAETNPKQQCSNTGFGEALKLQHIPGQAIISPDTTSSSVNTDEEKFKNLLQEIKSLKSEVKDLKEKYETLKVEQLQHKEKGVVKMKLQLEQLLENKSPIMQSHISSTRTTH
jgi:hypothetical protein